MDKEKRNKEKKDFEIPITDSSEVKDESVPGAGENQDIESLNLQIELQKQADLFKDQLLRKAAEFENYKKRTESEALSLYKYANEGLILELLPVLDDFERVIKSWNEKHDAETFRKGIELVYDKFSRILQKRGLKEIDSKGKQFNVHLHEALMQAPVKGVEPNTITEVAEKGYMLKDKILRHAKVIVSAKAE